MKTIKFLSMAALALVGAMMTGCSSDDNIIDTPQQPENTGNVVTLTTTVGLNEGAKARGTTRALGIDYENKQAVKTFAAGETMAIVYKNKSGNTVKAVSAALTDGDITTTADPATNKKSATFTFELTDPDKTQAVTYIYPAAMANDDGTVNYAALNSQNGTLGTLESSLDLATFSDNWNGTSLPAGTLENQLAVCALTLKDNAGSSTITSDLTQVIVSDGSITYTVAPTSGTFGENVIYVAIRPVTAALQYTATDGTKNYTKTATSRGYVAGNFYNLGLRMVETVPAATGHALSVSAVGEIVCSDGLAYDAADKDNLPSGVTAVAMVAYKGASAGSSLAIALTDEGSMNWSTAKSTCEVKDPIGGNSWRLPSINDWQHMFIGCGGSYNEEDDEWSYGELKDKLTAAGGTALNTEYWSSTEAWSGVRWTSNFYGSIAYFGQYMEGYAVWVRACLAF